MTRFTFTNDHTWGDGDGPRSVTIATENLSGFDKYKDKMKAAVREATLRLGNAFKNTDIEPQEDVVQALRKYFLLEKPYDAEAIAKIRSVILMTKLGLGEGPIQVKIHDAADMHNPQYLGYVRMRAPDTIRKTNAKTHYTTPTYMADSTQRRVGAMHLKGSALSLGRSNDVATRLLIHEATHKFAGTYDYHYFTTLDGAQGTDPWGDKRQALANADSYAWFVWEVGDPMVTLEYVDG